METIEVEANGIRHSALVAGSGPLVLCLHGFPDDARTYRYQVPALVAAGYRVVCPYLRGYAPSEPAPDGNYQTAALAHDAIALIDELGDGSAAVVGHDWGAITAYGVAVLAPHKVRRLATLAVPYGPQLATAFLTNYAQQKRSWYMYFFQLPTAEMSVAHDDLAFIRELWRDWSPGFEDRDGVVDGVVETLSKPGVLDAALGYYRSMWQPERQDPALAADQGRIVADPVTVETLYLHGADDGCLGVELTEGMEAAFPGGLTKEVVDGAGHFLHLEKPDLVTERIVEFFGTAD